MVPGVVGSNPILRPKKRIYSAFLFFITATTAPFDCNSPVFNKVYNFINDSFKKGVLFKKKIDTKYSY